MTSLSSTSKSEVTACMPDQHGIFTFGSGAGSISQLFSPKCAEFLFVVLVVVFTSFDTFSRSGTQGLASPCDKQGASAQSGLPP